MKKMNKRVYSGLAICAGLSGLSLPAYAQLAKPAPYQFDGGPLGQLEGAAAIDGYLFAQSGASENSVVGTQTTGAKLDAWMIELRKPTGYVQFTFQAAEFQDINLGTNKPTNVNDNRFITGPVRDAYVTLAPIQDLKLSVGQVPSIEGYESVFPWNNPVGLRTVIAEVENSDSRGVQADYSHGPFSGTVIFGDGYDTGVYDYLQLSGTDKIDANNQFTVFAGIPLGVTGPNAFAYGTFGKPSGGANDVGGQGQLANVNSYMLGGWYTWTDGGLSVIPEVQAQYTPALNRYAGVTSGGISDDIPKDTGNFAAALFVQYKFKDTPFSIGGWAEYGTSYGSAAQDAWFTAPDSKLVGFAVAPTWQYKHLYARLNVGYVHLVDAGTPAAGYGSGGDGVDQVTSTMEFGLLF